MYTYTVCIDTQVYIYLTGIFISALVYQAEHDETLSHQLQRTLLETEHLQVRDLKSA